MKSKNIFYHTMIFAGLILILSCKKESELDCNIKHYVPENDLSWFPYYSNQGDTTPNKFFQIEDNIFHLIPQELNFYSEALDSQKWKLVYVLDKEYTIPGEECPLFQELEYTIYNSYLDRHIQLGLETRLPSDSLSTTDDFATRIKIGVCKTNSEDSEGILKGTCYSTTFEINNYNINSRIEYLTVFETEYATYEDVFLIAIKYASDNNADYDIYISKNHGIIAYKNQDVIWELN